MRKIVYQNIMKLIKENHSSARQTLHGTRYVLRGEYGTTILSLYRDPYKIKLFINDVLFASESLKKRVMPFDQTYEHLQQLYKIERALKGEPTQYAIAPNFSAKCRARCGATPKQTGELHLAWSKSCKINYVMYDALGNSR